LTELPREGNSMSEWWKPRVTSFGGSALALATFFLTVIIGRCVYFAVHHPRSQTQEKVVSVSKALGDFLADIYSLLALMFAWLHENVWPSPHTWNQTMFASVLLLVVLGIATLAILLVRLFRSP